MSDSSEVIDVCDSDEEREIKNRSDEKKMEKVKKKKKRKRSGEKQKPRKKKKVVSRMRTSTGMPVIPQKRAPKKKKYVHECKNKYNHNYVDCLGVGTATCGGCVDYFCEPCANECLGFHCETPWCKDRFCEKCFKGKVLWDCNQCKKKVCFSCDDLRTCNQCNSSFCSECKPRDKCGFCGEWACPTCVCCTDKSCLLTGKCSGNIEKLF